MEADPNGQGENPTDGGVARYHLRPCGQPWTGSSDSSRGAGDSFWAFGSCSSSLAVPFAAQQTKHLTAGGFEVPGSGSQAVVRGAQALPGRADRAADRRLRQLQEGRRRARCLESTRPRRRSRGSTTSGVAHGAAAAAKAAGDQPIVLMPLDVEGGARLAVDAAVDLRKNLHIQDNGNLALPVTSSASRRCGRACRTSPKKDLEKAEFAGFPVVFIVLLAVFGSLAAALLPFSLGRGGRRRSRAPRSTSSPRRCRCRSS